MTLHSKHDIANWLMYLLQATAAEVSPIKIMLTHIFQQSLDSGIVLTQWKHAYAQCTKGSKSDPKNYRPISFMSVVCKCHCELNNKAS